MRIPIRCEGGSPATWAMIELQGELERKDGGTLAEAFDVGTLTASTSGSVLLNIGYHQLEGQRVPLKKPLAVLEKVACGEGGQTEYKVVGVMRERYIFKGRPRPMISKPDGKR